jgi:hypothetical protein
MAYATINKPNLYYNTVLYTGNGTTLTVTGVNFKPDLVWMKDRTVGYDNVLQDSVRGTTKIINSDTNYVEFTNSTSVTSFDVDGFTTGGYGATNASTTPFVSRNWLGSNTTTNNTSGTISSTVCVNTTSGFSIVSYTGTGAVATVGHGIGIAPKMIIVKRRSGSTEAWPVDARQVSGIFYLNETGAKGSYGNTEPFPTTVPTSSVFSLGSAPNANASGSPMIAYCFAEVKGFSKFSSYTGNGSTNGTFVYTGFKPAFVMIKRDFAGYDWLMFDNKRQNTFNVIDDFLYANISVAEVTGNANQAIDFVSNGFKCRGTGGSTNGSGGTFIYMAFAENPLVGTNNVPTTAR